jgi:hypothetical protein
LGGSTRATFFGGGSVVAVDTAFFVGTGALAFAAGFRALGGGGEGDGDLRFATRLRPDFRMTGFSLSFPEAEGGRLLVDSSVVALPFGDDSSRFFRLLPPIVRQAFLLESVCVKNHNDDVVTGTAATTTTTTMHCSGIESCSDSFQNAGRLEADV